tara:strand:- start:184 stop:717 length:534 start_codon:yes stop_codon:yes gene_type:complete
MSRVGKMPIPIPGDVEIKITGNAVSTKGKLGELMSELPDSVKITSEESIVNVMPKDDSQKSKADWGLSRAIISNMVTGVDKGFKKELEIHGVGYRASIDGEILTLQLGYSHDIKVAIPKDIKITCPKPTEIVLTGASKQRVGQLAAEIRAFRKPEPYKGKGVRYTDEYVRRKEGKKK